MYSTVIGSFDEYPQAWLLQVNTFQWYDGITWMHGKHAIKAGLDIHRIQADSDFGTHANGQYYFYGQYTGDGFAEFLLGEPSVVDGALHNSAQQYRETQMAYYIADEWRAKSNLTVNLGFRYEYYTAPWEKSGETPVFDPTLGNGIGGLLYPANNRHAVGNGSAQLFYTNIRPDLPWGYLDRNSAWTMDHKGFAPRLSFAYRPFGSTKTTIRGGYGWYISSPVILNIVQNAGSAPPASLWPEIDADPAKPNLTWDGLPGVPAADFLKGANFGVLTGPETHYLNPYTQQWSLTVGQMLTPSTGFEVQYMGSKTTHGLSLYDYNYRQPSSDPLPEGVRWPEWSRVKGYSSGANANYNALMASANQRVAHGLTFKGAYTYSHALHCCNAFNMGGTVQNPGDFHNTQTSANFDMRHVFTLSYVYELPFGPGKAFGPSLTGPLGKLIGGWRTSGIASMHTGFPTAVSVSSNNCNSAFDYACYPDVVGKALLGGNGVNSPKYDYKAFDWPFNHTPAQAPRWGNAEPNQLWGDGTNNWDMAILKDTKVNERVNTEFRFEMFNAFNHPSFGSPGGNPQDPSSFGWVFSAGPARQLQFGLKIYF